MAGTKEIKNRIKSIQSTRQITKAMEIVSTTKFKKYSQLVIKSRAYKEGIKNILERIAYGVKSERHSLFDGRENIKKIALVVFSADRGLAGGFNSIIAKEVENFLKTHQNIEIEFIAIGRKIRDYLQKNNFKLVKEYIRVSEDIATSISTEISSFLVKTYNDEQYDEVYLIYNKFITALRYDLTVEKIIPIDRIKKEIEENTNYEKEIEKTKNYIFEPNAEKVLSALLPRFVNVQVFQAMLNNMASEHSARKNAMTNATDSADEMMKQLNLDYNRKRQASITQEITEIVGGASTL